MNYNYNLKLNKEIIHQRVSEEENTCSVLSSADLVTRFRCKSFHEWILFKKRTIICVTKYQDDT